MIRTQRRRRKQPDCEYVKWRIAINGCETGKNKNGDDGEVDSPKWVLEENHAINEKWRDVNHVVEW